MSQNLQVMVLEFNNIVSAIAEAGGELTPELEAAFDGMGAQIQVKADSYAFVMDRLDAEAEFWKKRAEQFSRVAKSCKNLKERLNDSIKMAMKQLGTDEVHGVDMRFKLTRMAPKLVIQESLLPSEYKMVVTETVPDKERIKADLANKCEVPGAVMEEVLALRKYVNSKK